MPLPHAGSERSILTFNHHESFLCALSGVGGKFDVVIRRGNLDLGWNVRNRQVPKNFRLIEFKRAVKSIGQGDYDAIVCHTIKNLFWLLPYKRRNLIFVAHIPLFKNSTLSRIKSFVKRLTVLTWQKLFDLKVIAVSDFKKNTWGIDAEVTRFFPVPFPAELLSPEKSPKVRGVFVGNDIKERGEELGFGVLEPLLNMLPIQVIGFNPSIPNAFIPSNFTDFVGEFSKAHFYVYTVSKEYGDGYNTAMLEAMLLGLPVVTVANPTSPIVHNVNGLVAKDAAGMMGQIKLLMADEALRTRLGRAARETVLKDFSPEVFWNTWKKVIDLASPKKPRADTSKSEKK